MSQNNEFDVGPLTWVKAEIETALNAARSRLDEVQASPDQREPLRFAQTYVHQASGALSIVGLDGVSQFADAIDKLLSCLAAAEAGPQNEALVLVGQSIGILGNYLNEVSAGAPHQPLRLYPTYRQLVEARGVEPPPPSELFFPDTNIHIDLGESISLDPQRATHELRVLRGRFEKGLLNWLRRPADKAGPEEMLKAVRRIEQIQSMPATRAFWWSSIAFFEGLAEQTIEANKASQRLCRRIDAQMRRLLEGSQVIADRLVRDVLYFVATSAIRSPHAQTVREIYQLDLSLPAADAELSPTLRHPIAARVREVLEQAKELWNRFCAGAAVALPQFQDLHAELRSRAEQLRIAQIDRLLSSTHELLKWLRGDPLRISDGLSMEMATALLVVEQATDSPNSDPELLRKQVDLLCAQFAERCRGAEPAPLDDHPFGEATRRAQDRLFFNQLAREIQTNLGQIEQTLDTFFRNPAQRAALPSLASPLKQVEGAFAVLGEAEASRIIAENAARVAAFATQDSAPDTDECQVLAHQLSAIGFFVEALRSGPAKLESFLDPLGTKKTAQKVVAPVTTVEEQIKREVRETQNLAEALKESPEDAFLRQALVSSLQAIREDAQLLDDGGLEQKAKEALKSLNAGESAPEQIAEALAEVSASTTPQPSEEVARLMNASTAELDAELLAIFLEEANEVLATISEYREICAAEPHNAEALTTVRRGYHTLKGSSRMVGLQDFSEAARHVEMTMNRWLQTERDANADLLSLVDAGHREFDAWVKQLEGGGSPWRDASALIAQAQALLDALSPPIEVSAPTPAPVALATPVEAPAAAPIIDDVDLQSTHLADHDIASLGLDEAGIPGQEPTTLDLTSTLLSSDLEALAAGDFGRKTYDLSEPDLEEDLLPVLGDSYEPARVNAKPATDSVEAVAAIQAQPVSTAEMDLATAVEESSEDIGDKDSGAESETELDLTATLLEGDFIFGGEEYLPQPEGAETETEIDLTATLLESDFNFDSQFRAQEPLPEPEAPSSAAEEAPSLTEVDLTATLVESDFDFNSPIGAEIREAAAALDTAESELALQVAEPEVIPETELDLSTTDIGGYALLEPSAEFDTPEATDTAALDIEPLDFSVSEPISVEPTIPTVEEEWSEVEDAAAEEEAETLAEAARLEPEEPLAETPLPEIPVEPSAGMKASETLDETPNEIPVEVPNEIPAEMPAEVPDETPVEIPQEIPVEAPVEAPAELPVEAPDEVPTEALAESPPGTPAASLEDTSLDGLEVVAIDGDDDDGDIDLPSINFRALQPNTEPNDSMVARVNELVGESEASETTEQAPVEEPDADIVIGKESLSRGLYDLYVAEARQHIDFLNAEQKLLSSNPMRVPVIDAVRAAHTLAGISGTARIEPAYALGKALEHALHRFTDIDIAPDEVDIATIGAAIATLDAMLVEVQRFSMPLEVPGLIEQLQSLRPRFDEPALPQEELPPNEPSPASVPELVVEAAGLPTVPPVAAPTSSLDDEGPQDELDEQLLPIFFEEADELGSAIGGALRDLRADPGNPVLQQALARLLHTFKGSARMAGAMRLGHAIHGLETRLDAAIKAQSAEAGLVDELEGGLDHLGSLLNSLRSPAGAASMPTSGADEGAIATSPVRKPASDWASAPIHEEIEVGPSAQRAALRVKAESVDRFVNEAGEIAIARTRIEGEMRILRRSLLDLTENVIRLRNQLREVEIQAESQMQSRIAAAEAEQTEFDPLEFDRFTRLQELTRMMAESVGDVTTIQQNLLRNLDSADAALHAQGRLSRDLQQELMNVRMVPFEESADRLYRIVRQTSKELGKRANLDIQGGSIELDRSVLDRMVAPIEHLLRNAIAHGIESPEVRQANGKPEFGQITLKLTQLSNEIALEIADDGSGLDYERILQRGRDKGLVGQDEHPGENRLTQLIYEPGFSTADAVSGIAGRGVGMDVVKNETLAVGGRVDTFSTQGQGTRFLIHLPLTLAITQALLVRAGDRTYAIPSNMVEQAQELKEGPLKEVIAKKEADWNGTRYPYAYLPRLLGDMHSQPAQKRFHWLLLLRSGSQTLALHIDELRGNQEIVVKNAGPQFVRLTGFTGATVLPDGEISLILNPVTLATRQTTAIPTTVVAGGEAVEEVVEEARETHIPTIMVVDDSLTVRKITSRLLEREGFRVVTAKDGVDALEQLVDFKPDVMLLDIEMPRMDGFDLARNVRADARLHDLPIIMITSRTADKHRNYAMEIGVNNYLGKPYQEEVLLELITGFIAANRR